LLGSLIKSLILERKELEGKKFLGYFRLNELKWLEEMLETDLGVKNQRKTRPFIGFHRGDTVFICFLTTRSKSKGKRVDIKLCSKSGCPRYNFMEYSYIFYDIRRRGFYIYEFPKEYIKDKYVHCGFCKDLEFIDNLPKVDERS